MADKGGNFPRLSKSLMAKIVNRPAKTIELPRIEEALPSPPPIGVKKRRRPSHHNCNCLHQLQKLEQERKKQAHKHKKPYSVRIKEKQQQQQVSSCQQASPRIVLTTTTDTENEDTNGDNQIRPKVLAKTRQPSFLLESSSLSSINSTTSTTTMDQEENKNKEVPKHWQVPKSQYEDVVAEFMVASRSQEKSRIFNLDKKQQQQELTRTHLDKNSKAQNEQSLLPVKPKSPSLSPKNYSSKSFLLASSQIFNITVDDSDGRELDRSVKEQLDSQSNNKQVLDDFVRQQKQQQQGHSNIAIPLSSGILPVFYGVEGNGGSMLNKRYELVVADPSTTFATSSFSMSTVVNRSSSLYVPRKQFSAPYDPMLDELLRLDSPRIRSIRHRQSLLSKRY